MRGKAVVFVVAIFAASSVQARQCLEWVLPVARRNGMPLDKSELESVQIKYTRTIAKGVEQGSRDLALKTKHCFNFQIPGTYEFSVAVTDKDKMQSGFSNIVTIDVK